MKIKEIKKMMGRAVFGMNTGPRVFTPGKGRGSYKRNQKHPRKGERGREENEE